MPKKVDDRRKQNKRAKKRNSILKAFLMLIAMLVLAVGVFVGTVKLISPDFDFNALIPKKAVDFVSSLAIRDIELPQTTATTTAPTTTTQPYLDYLEHESFSLDANKKGASIGNILNGGKVEKDGDYFYHIVDGKGIYRFYVYNESFVSVYKTDDELSSLNAVGDYLYFINDTKHSLVRFNKRDAKMQTIMESINSVLMYDKIAYCINSNNQVAAIDVDKQDTYVLYTASAEEDVRIVGISDNNLFVTTKGDMYTKYLVIDLKGDDGVLEFKPMTLNSEMLSLVFDNGFMYYYQKQVDNSYNLVRQKFGSQKIITLVENATDTKPVIVDKNRLFYSEYKDKKLKMKELNMNSMKTKTMLSVSNVEADNSLIIQHGGEYDFIIGKKSGAGDKVYNASSNLTSSTNVMKFSKGSWSY